MPEERGEQLTHAQREQLEAELADLEGPKRRAVVEAIATARGHGDLSENFEYHAAKNEQGLLERRIAILRSRLQHAEVIDEAAAAASGVVSVGATVDLEREDGEMMTVEISSVGGVSPRLARRTCRARQGGGRRGRGRGAARRVACAHRLHPPIVVEFPAVSAVSVQPLDELGSYEEDVSGCTRCRLAQGRTQVVFGAGIRTPG